jgi:hypothetical protein
MSERRGTTSGEFWEVSSRKVQNLPYGFDGTFRSLAQNIPQILLTLSSPSLSRRDIGSPNSQSSAACRL